MPRDDPRPEPPRGADPQNARRNTFSAFLTNRTGAAFHVLCAQQQRPPGGRQLLAIPILFEQNLLQAALQSPDSPGHCCRIGTKCGRCSPDLSRACDGQEKTKLIPVHTPAYLQSHTAKSKNSEERSLGKSCDIP